MAEGLLKSLYPERYEVYSAGLEPSKVSEYAIKVMAEIGIDISHNRSKSIDEFIGQDFDYVMTVCNDTRETCLNFPGGKRYIHKSFPDPSLFTGTEEEKFDYFRELRDEIRIWLSEVFEKEV